MPSAVALYISTATLTAASTITFTQILYATYAAAAVLSVGIGNAQKRKLERRARDAFNAGLQDRNITTRGTVEVRQMVLGRVRTGGTIAFVGSSGPLKEKLTIVIALASHRIAGVDAIYFNDEQVTLDASGYVTGGSFFKQVLENGTASMSLLDGEGSVTLPNTPIGPVQVTRLADGNYRFPLVANGVVSGNTVSVSGLGADLGSALVSYQYYKTATAETSKARIRWTLGGDDQAAFADLVTNFPGQWTTNHRGRGVAYLVAELDYDPDVYPSGIPNITAVVRGADQVLDPRTGLTGYTENPALLLRHYLLHPLGGKRTASQLDAASFITAANVCDSSVNYGDGATQIYKAGYVARTDQTPASACDELAEAMAGRWGYSGGVIRVRAGAVGAAVAAIDESWMAEGVLSVAPSLPRAQLGNAVQGTFIDPANKWQQVQFPRVPVGAEAAAMLAEDGGSELAQEVEFAAINRAGQAQQVAAVLLRETRQGLTVTVDCNMRAYTLQLFDTVTLTVDRYGWDGKLFEVVGRSFTLGGAIRLTLRETGSSIYAFGTSFGTVDALPNTSLPNPFTVAQMGAVTATSGPTISADGSIVTRVVLTWAAPTDSNVLRGGYIELAYRDATLDAALQTVRADSFSGHTIVGLQGGGAYTFQVRAVNGLGVKGNWSTLTTHSVYFVRGPLTFIQDDSPSEPLIENDLWFDTNDGNKQYVRRSGAWVLVRDEGIDQAIADAADALANAGLSVYTATVYQQALTQPAPPSGGSFNFSTATLVAPTGWSVSQPDTTGTPTWATEFTFTTNTPATTVTGGTWAAPHVEAVNGDGGAGGADGQSVLVFEIYRESATQPATPTGGSYTFSTDAFTAPSLWSRNIPTVGTTPVWRSVFRFATNTPAVAVSAGTWGTPTRFAQAGAAGDTGPIGPQGPTGTPGTQQANVYLYQWATAQPENPGGSSTWTWATGANTAYNGGNGWLVAVGANPGTPGSRLWISTRSVTATAGTATTSVNWTTGVSVYAATVNGDTGPSGSPGIKSASPTVWRWALSIPTIIGTSTYTWASASAGTPPTNWTSVPGTGTPGQTLWGATVQLVDAAGATTSEIDWSTASVTARGYAGTNGEVGAASTSYWLARSAAAVQQAVGGAFTPAAVTFSAFSATGTAAPAAYAGRFMVSTSTDGSNYTERYTSASNQTSYAYTVPASTKTIRVRLYLAGGTTTLLDEEVIPVVSDGATGNIGPTGDPGLAGLNGLTVVVSNEAHTLPASSAGAVSSYTGSGATVQVYEGSTALSASSTATVSAFRIGTITQAPVSTLTVGAVTYSGTTATIAQHAAMVNGTDAVVLTIPVTIYRANGTSVTVTKTQTLTKARQGAQGNTGETGNTGQTGISARRAYTLTSLASLGSGSVTVAGIGGLPPSTSVFGTGLTWTATPGVPAEGQQLFQSDGLFNPATGNSVFETPYISALKVGNLAALAVNTGSLTVSGTLTMGSGGIVTSSNYTSGPGGAGWRLSPTSVELPATSIRGLLSLGQLPSGALNSELVPSINTAGTTATWAGVSGAGRPADSATVGASFTPTRFDNLTMWTGFGAGDPASVTVFNAGTIVTGDADFGTCLNITGFTNGGNLNMRDVLPAVAGRIYRVSTRFKVTALSSDGSMSLGVAAHGMTAAYAGTTPTSIVSTINVTDSGIKTVTALFSNTASSGVIAWPAGSSYLRFGFRSNSGESGMVLRVDYVIVEDVTDAFNAARAASDAQTTADDATTALTTKLNKNAADTLTAPITLSTSGAIQALNGSKNIIINSTGIVATADGVVKLAYSNSTGDLAVRGDISGSTGSFVGSMSVAGRTWTTGNGIFLGVDGGHARAWIGSSTQYLRYDAQTGALTLKLAALTSSMSPTGISAFPTTADPVFIGSATATPSGGTAPYLATWTLDYFETEPVSVATLRIIAISGTYGQTASFGCVGLPNNAEVRGSATCQIIDADGRVTKATVTLGAIRGTPP